MTAIPPQVPHQLLIHLDYPPEPGPLTIVYSYPFSTPHEVRETFIRLTRDAIPTAIKEDLLTEALRSRIPTSAPIRLPHAEVPPVVRPGVATIVIQDRKRAAEIPHARLYYCEEAEAIHSEVEREIQMRPRDFSTTERASWNRLRERIKGIAWKHYEGAVRLHIRS